MAARLMLPGLLVLVAACGGGGSNQPGTDGLGTLRSSGQEAEADVRSPGAAPGPEQLAEGKQLFDANCARCHGPGASGTQAGPPLVHMVYEPNHHADVAFQRAVAQGSPAHHWSFGDMPPVPGVTPEQVNRITAYVRHLQREAGIGL